MSRNRIIFLAVGAAFLVIVVAVLVVVLTRDEATSRYDGMAIALEDQCKLLNDPGKCTKFAECFRDGLEAALPRDLATADKYEDLPEAVRKAVDDLVRRCGAEAGLPA